MSASDGRGNPPVLDHHQVDRGGPPDPAEGGGVED